MKKHFPFLMIYLLTGIMLLVACSHEADKPSSNGSVADATTAGFPHPDMRIESEDKLTVPVEKTEEVWNFMHETFVADVQKLQSIDAAFTAYFYEEHFVDTYFDTPDLQLLAMQSGVRHRRRENITNPDDKKSGKELMQVKLNDISSNELHRGEVKFDIDYPHKFTSMDDKHPAIGIVKRGDRDEFKETLAKIGIDANDLQPILTLKQIRRRVYINHNNSPFMSLSLDEVSSEALWAKIKFTELEPELNEVAYTEADAYTKEDMDEIGEKISKTVTERFPYITRDLTPKYNKCFNALAEKVPFYRFLLKHELL